MTKQVQRRRGTSTQHTSFTGAEGEISVNTTNKSIHVHDGLTAGGVEAARADLTNVSDANLNAALSGNTLSSLTITSVDINGGTIDGAVIGGSSPAAGTFTTANATTVDTTNIEVTTLKAKDGTSAGSIADSTGVVTLASSVLTTTDINGGTIDGAVIGGSSAAAGTFTTLTASGDVTIADKIVHSGDTNTAIRFPAADTVTVETSGAERLRVDSSGNVGVGTASPSDGYRLDVVRDAGGTAALIRASNNIDAAFNLNAVQSGGIQMFNRNSGYLTLGTNNTERMRIDSSGNLGIGADKVFGSGNGYVGNTSAASSGTLKLWDASGHIDLANNWGSGAIKFTVGASERMRIDSSGNVGIGVASPSAKLEVTGDVLTTWEAASTKFIGSKYFAAYDLGMYMDTDNRKLTLSAKAADSLGTIAFETGVTPTERMRIDSSGNLLVGTTDTLAYNAGARISQQSLVLTNTSGTATDYIGYFNRQSSDGTFLQFGRANSPVGSIGSTASAFLYIGSGDTGLLYQSTANAIEPWNPSTNDARDNAIDLGITTNRFKNLYLSGGVYLGGTTSANLLDDYEEGSFTIGFAGATVSAANLTAHYTKIGRLVFFSYYSQASTISGASGAARVTGLPFTVKNDATYFLPFYTAHNTFFGGSATAGVEGYPEAGDTGLRFVIRGTITDATYVNSGSNVFIMLAGFYTTDA